jgi:hypothetical protein
MKDYSKVVRSFNNPELFARNYPDFHIFIDLKGFDENVKTYFPYIKNKIFDLIVEGNITSCYFNYDTSNGKYQIKEARSRGAFLIEDMDLISCDIKNGVLKNCNIYESLIKKSSLEDCSVVSNSTLTSCKVKSSLVEYTNELKECFIDCENKNINCKIEGGVIRAGNIGENAQVSKETLKVKGWDEIRKTRFITDSRLKDLNDKYSVPKFGNMNY